MLTSLTVVIILKQIRVSNHHVVQLKLTQFICELYLDKTGGNIRNQAISCGNQIEGCSLKTGKSGHTGPAFLCGHSQLP